LIRLCAQYYEKKRIKKSPDEIKRIADYVLGVSKVLIFSKNFKKYAAASYKKEVEKIFFAILRSFK
jgi:hypothetical protein